MRMFSFEVSLGEGIGAMQHELQPLFTSSELVTVRYPLPLELAAEPAQGVMRVYEDGNGLLVGDVLRACSTFKVQMDSSFGLFPMGTKPTKCLYIADGQPPEKVIDALTANTEDKADEILMIFERPLA